MHFIRYVNAMKREKLGYVAMHFSGTVNTLRTKDMDETMSGIFIRHVNAVKMKMICCQAYYLALYMLLEGVYG